MKKFYLATRFQVCMQEALENMRKRRARPTLNKAYDQHLVNWFNFGTHSRVSLVSVEICGGIVPVKALASRYLQEKKT